MLKKKKEFRSLRVYLDSNCLRELDKLPNDKSIEYSTSFYSVFELISGMTSESEYKRRLPILLKMKSIGLAITWSSFRSLFMKEVLGIIDNDDVVATKELYDYMNSETSYEDLCNYNFKIGDSESYNLELLIKHDNKVNSDIFGSLKSAISTVDRSQRKNLREDTFNSDYVNNNIDWLIKDMLLQLLQNNPKCVHNPQYVAWRELFVSGPFSEFSKGCMWGIYRTFALGQNPGSNDGLDYLQLLHSKSVDVFLSNDKLFHRLNDLNVFEASFLSLQELIQKVNAK